MSRIVYVGRIPFDLTEEQLEDIFKSVGPVENTRLMFDRGSGKSKGYAFVQYYNPESAASAIRNLDNYKVGNMRLKVNYSSGSFQSKPGPGAEPSAGDETEAGAIPDIVNAVTSLAAQDKRDILKEVQRMVAANPQRTAALLAANPQLAYALVQSMFELDLIDGKHTAALIIQPDQAPAPAPAPARGSRQNTPQAPYAPAPMAAASTASVASMPAPAPAPTSVPAAMPATAPAPAPMPAAVNPLRPAAPAAPLAPLDDAQRRFAAHVMQLSADQLAALPADQRDAALQLRNQIQSGALSL